jgi:hypothetical protein
VVVESRQLNPVGGNVTAYTLCRDCVQKREVRNRIQADIDQDEARAARIRSH